MLWQWGNLEQYSGSLTVGASFGHIHVYLRTGPEGTPGLCNTPLCWKKNKEHGHSSRGDSWTARRAELQSQSSTCSTGQMHPKTDKMCGKLGHWFCWLRDTLKVLFGRSSSNLLQNQDTALFHFFGMFCVLIFPKSLSKLLGIFTEKHFFFDAYHMNKWNCSFQEESWCQGSANNSLFAFVRGAL